MNNFKILGASFGRGAKVNGTEQGPKFLYQGLTTNLRNKFIDIDFEEAKFNNNILSIIAAYNLKLANAVKDSILQSNFPIIVGGDHSIACGTWSGVIAALNACEQFGLLWIDAHLDSHILETSPSKAYHGMPVAHLLGHGASELTSLLVNSPKLNPKYLTIFGARSFEPEEHDFLKKLGVKIFYAKDIHQRGIEECLAQALDIVRLAPGGYGISIDLDFFDPTLVPGIGSPEPNGFDPANIINQLKILKSDSRLKALEIAEYNPQLDIDFITRDIVIKIIEELIKP